MPAKGPVITDFELARFLRRLAITFRDPATGNPELGKALSQLADRLLSDKLPSKIAHQVKRDNLTSHTGYTVDLARLNPQEIIRLLDDEKTTKSDLIELAYARFSIPKAKLMRLNVFEVQEAIRSALLHEKSLDIISQEARRSGASRYS